MTARQPLFAPFLPLAVALFGVVAALTCVYCINPRFFFIDDRQAQYFPYGLIIKDMLLHGAFPIVTTRSFFGGALWLDPQNAIFNPFSLLMTLLIDPHHLELSGLLYAIAANLLLAGGGYALGRAYRLDAPLAALLGFATATNLYTLYFHAADWHPGAVSFGWALFAWAAMKRLLETKEKIAAQILISAVLIFMTVSSGWPHQDVALAVIMGVLFVESFRSAPAGRLRLIWTGALGAVFCLPLILPVLAALPWTARESGIINNGLFAPTFGDVLNFSNPAWRPTVTLFRPDQSIPFPFFFMTWYALPLAAFINLRAVKQWPLAPFCMTGLFLLLACCTGQIGPLRFPMRWLPDIHLCLLLSLFAILAQSDAVVSARRIFAALMMLALTTELSFLDNHAEAMNALRLVLLTAVLILLLPEALSRKQWLALYLGLTSLALMLLMVSAFPVIFDDLGKDNDTPAALTAARDRPIEYTLYSGSTHVLKGQDGKEEYLPAATATYYGVNTINGYSSLAHKDWGQIFHCGGYETARCAFPVPPLLRRAPETGTSYLDLLKVDEIVAEKGPFAEAAGKSLPQGWRRHLDAHIIRFTRAASNLPGTMSWHSPSISVSGDGADETASIRNESDKPALVVFAREYYPGFSAFLDKEELKARPVNGLFLGVDVPARAAGQLRLSFQPPFLVQSWLAALAGFLFWAAFALFHRDKEKAAL